jgi:catechol 2,3-dioxygenase-like lactoylglutathione lyase family enzyme
MIHAFLLENDTPGGSTHQGQHKMLNLQGQPRVTSFAPQFLVDDLARSMTYYQKLGFTFGEPWGGFYAIGELDGLELHLKEAPKNAAERRYRREHEHLDAAAGVDGIEAFYDRCLANGATILRPLAATAWGTKDFYIEDPDGHVIAFGGRPSARGASQESPCV